MNNGLSDVFNLTTAGKYTEAITEIYRLKTGIEKSSLPYAALLSYEATICYNQSKYEASVAVADSIISLLSAIDKSNRYIVKAYNIKAKSLSALNEFETAEKILDENKSRAAAIHDQNGLAGCFYLLGSIYSDKGIYLKSKELLLQSIIIRDEIGDELGLGAGYSFLGSTYAHLGDYMQGIEYIQKSITLREKNGDKRGLANSYLSLYKIYMDIGEADKALASELKSLDICREINDLQCVSGRLTNLGEIYQDKGEYEKALTYHFLALTISKQVNIKNRIAEVHENIAKNYTYTKRYEAAIKHLDSCMAIRKLIGDEEGQVSTVLVLTEIYYNQHKLNEALENGNQALNAGLKLKLPYLIKNAHQLLSNTYDQLNNTDKALYHFKQYIVLRDSLYNIDKTKEIVRKELEFNFNKKQELQKLEVAKKLEETDAESRKQRIIILFTIFGMIILTALLVFGVYQYRLKISSEKKLQYLNSDLNLKNYQLLEKSDIIDGDCTGHGVPGGFMSMLGVSLLNEIINEHDLTEPALILSRLRKKVITALRQKGLSGEQQDGMDMTICVIDKTQLTLQYAAANHSFYLVRKSEIGYLLQEYKGDKQPVGIFGNDLKPFKQYPVELKKDDVIYTMTDGFADQFGGAKGKKFKYKQLKEMLLSIQENDLASQEEIIRKRFSQWKGNLEQVDDVTIIGIRI